MRIVSNVSGPIQTQLDATTALATSQGTLVPKSQYIFDPVNKTIVFGEKYYGLELTNILFITNVTSSNTIIYQFNNSTLGGTFSGKTLTLTYNTSAMSSRDDLQIIVVPPSTVALADTTNKEILDELKMLRQMLSVFTGVEISIDNI